MLTCQGPHFPCLWHTPQHGVEHYGNNQVGGKQRTLEQVICSPELWPLTSDLWEMPHSWLGTNMVREGQCNFVGRWTFNTDLETMLGFTSACVQYWEGASLDIAHKSPTSVLCTHLMSRMPHKALKSFDPQTTTTWAPFDAPYPRLVLPSTLPDKLGIQGHPWDPMLSLTVPYPAISYWKNQFTP